MTLKELLTNTAIKTLDLQQNSGAFPAGHNGPYKDPETPVRNTAHWLFTLSHLFELTDDSKWKKAAEGAIEYLMSDKARPMKASFWCRKNPEKDFCNGIMGQAWIIEALIKAFNVFDREDCYNLAEEVFLLHPWDNENKIWGRVNVEGSYPGPDVTFNHQLWFGAIAGFLKNTEEAITCSKKFFDHHGQNVIIFKNGVIYHNSPLIGYNFSLKKIDESLQKVRQIQNITFRKKQLWHKSAGYHAFNLYAYSLYKQSLPKHKYWRSEKFIKMLSVVQTESFVNEQLNNQYSFPYNPTGIELAYAFETFAPEKKDRVRWWLQEQFNRTALSSDYPMLKGTEDSYTSSARIYEAARLKGNYKLKI